MPLASKAVAGNPLTCSVALTATAGVGVVDSVADGETVGETEAEGDFEGVGEGEESTMKNFLDDCICTAVAPVLVVLLR